MPLFRQGSNDHQPGQPVDPLPHYIPPRESAHTDPELAARYPLNLLTPKSHAYLNSSFGQPDHQRQVQKEPSVIIHPDDAAERGIADGDRCGCSTTAASSPCWPSSTTPCCRAWWCPAWAAGASTRKAGATLAAVNSTRFADLGNAPTFSDTLVEVEIA